MLKNKNVSFSIMKNRLVLTLILIIMLIIACILAVMLYNTINLHKSEQPPSEGLEFVLNKDGNGYTLTGIGSCADVDVTVPSNYNGKPVTAVADGAFRVVKTLRSVKLPESITHIGAYAFCRCLSLERVVLGEATESIGSAAFSDCTSLSSIDIPESVTEIGDYAFSCCDSLSSINVSRGNEKYVSIDGNLYTKDEKTLIKYAAGKMDTSFDVPDTVTVIDSSAFSGCRLLKFVNIPNGVKTVERDAFNWFYSLESIVIPDSVTGIGDGAFDFCPALQTVTIGAGVESIGYNTFSFCGSLISIAVSKDNEEYTSIDGNLYSKDGTVFIRYCSGLTNGVLDIPEGVTKIEANAVAFSDYLEGVNIPVSVTVISDFAFEGCELLKSIYYAGTVEQWKAIEKVVGWNTWTRDYTIYCADGTISY